ncbi:histidine kinase, partial [Alcaligenes faecalis]
SLDRLMQAYEHEQQLVADAAHQLRTPLAVMSLRLQT